jgi:hypothetical protein
MSRRQEIQFTPDEQVACGGSVCQLVEKLPAHHISEFCIYR